MTAGSFSLDTWGRVNELFCHCGCVTHNAVTASPHETPLTCISIVKTEPIPRTPLSMQDSECTTWTGTVAELMLTIFILTIFIAKSRKKVHNNASSI